MTQQQEDIYANDRMDLIIPYGKIGEEYYQQIIAPYTPTILNDQFAVIHVPMRSNAILGNIQFVYSLVPNLYVPLDTTVWKSAESFRRRTSRDYSFMEQIYYLGLWIRGSTTHTLLF